MPVISINIQTAATQYVPETSNPVRSWLKLMEEMSEDRNQIKLTWIPAKVRSIPVFPMKKRYQKTFTGTMFRIGGSKK